MNFKSLWSCTAQLVCDSAILAVLAVGVISYCGVVVSGGSDRCARHTQVRELQGEVLRESRWRP